MTSADAVSILPPLAFEEARHSSRVLQAVRSAIAAGGGWIAFDEYLRIVLYAPGLGYYSAGCVKLGRGGDFITAPELSAMYGRCIARQCAEVLAITGGDVLELGAGSGALAASLLSRLAELDALPAHYDILEISAELRARQRERLAQLPPTLRSRVRWLEGLPDRPLTGVVLANEVADALPFKRFVVRDGTLLERGVAACAEQTIAEVDRPADAALRARLERVAADVGPWPPHYVSELCPMLGPWIASLAACLARGALLLFDYGLARREYYHRQRSAGTMQCHFRHRAHADALRHPGLQDISAWVDFTQVAEAASDAALEVAGYCTQAAFLLAMGIEAEVGAAADSPERARRASEARQLLLPGEMGEIFKAMALTRGLQRPPGGFVLQDLRRSL